MIKNYLIIAWRNLLRNKFISLINIGGLAIGISSFMIIAIYVSYEFSYDDFFKDKDRIFRYAEYLKAPGEYFRFRNLAGSETKKFLVQLPGIESVARMVHHPGIFVPSAIVSYFKADDARKYAFNETGIFVAEQSLLDIFGFPFIHGDPTTALKQEYSVVISKSTALKYFNSTSRDLIGKTLYISQTEDKIKEAFTITGVMEDLRDNSHFSFDMLLSYTTYSTIYPEAFEDAFDYYFHTYIKLLNGYEPDSLNKEWPDFINAAGARVYRITKEEYIKNKESYFQAKTEVQPLNSIYLSPSGDREFSTHGKKRNLYLLAGIALAILLIAWINYINLSLIQLTTRAKEVGVRKVIGASKNSITGQFLVETFNANLISIAISITIIPIIIPPLSDFLNKELDTAIWYNGNPNIYLFWGILFFVFLISTLITGLYPSIVFSNAQPVMILKSYVHGLGRIFSPKKKLSNGFVLTQFTAAYILIALTIATFLQLKYLQDKNLGFNTDQVLVLKTMLNSEPEQKRLSYLKELLNHESSVKHASTSSCVPGKSNEILTGLWNFHGEPNWCNPGNISVDSEFLNVLGIHIIAGRNFRPEEQVDLDAILVSKTTAQALGYDNPEDILGNIFGLGGVVHQDTSRTRRVIGVFEDYHQMSPKERIKPLFLEKEGTLQTTMVNDDKTTRFEYRDRDRSYLSIQLSPENMPSTLKKIKSTWEEVFPDFPFDYFFMDENYNAQYHSDLKFGYIFLFFTIISISLACLGFLGMSLFLINRRTKEIGIRKVMGASLTNLFGLMIYRFMLLILFAGIVGIPFTWFILRNLLNEFAYRIDLSWWLFALPLALILIIALLTIGGITLRKVNTNPVKALRYE